MIPIEVSQANGCDVVQVHSGAFKPLRERARANPGVYEQYSGRRAKDRCVSGRAACKDT